MEFLLIFYRYVIFQWFIKFIKHNDKGNAIDLMRNYSSCNCLGMHLIKSNGTVQKNQLNHPGVLNPLFQFLIKPLAVSVFGLLKSLIRSLCK